MGELGLVSALIIRAYIGSRGYPYQQDWVWELPFLSEDSAQVRQDAATVFFFGVAGAIHFSLRRQGARWSWPLVTLLIVDAVVLFHQYFWAIGVLDSLLTSLWDFLGTLDSLLDSVLTPWGVKNFMTVSRFLYYVSSALCIFWLSF